MTFSAFSTVMYLTRAGGVPGCRDSGPRRDWQESAFFTARLKVAVTTLVRFATVPQGRFRGPLRI